MMSFVLCVYILNQGLCSEQFLIQISWARSHSSKITFWAYNRCWGWLNTRVSPAERLTHCRLLRSSKAHPWAALLYLTLLWALGWACWPPEVVSNLNNSVVLCGCVPSFWSLLTQLFIEPHHLCPKVVRKQYCCGWRPVLQLLDWAVLLHSNCPIDFYIKLASEHLLTWRLSS